MLTFNLNRLLNILGDTRFFHFLRWTLSLQSGLYGAPVHKFVLYSVGAMLLSPLVVLAGYSPVICFALSLSRLREQDYGSYDGDQSNANLKPALKLFYSLTLAQGAIFMSVLIFQNGYAIYLPIFIRRHGFTTEVIHGYSQETVLRSISNPESTKSWNLITYGAGLLDSELHDDFVLGARALNMLIEQGNK